MNTGFAAPQSRHSWPVFHCAEGLLSGRGIACLEQRTLSRWWRLDMNTLQLEHSELGGRAARRGKTTNLAASCQDPVARDDQRDRVLGHGLTHIARGFWPRTQLLGQRAIGGC